MTVKMAPELSGLRNIKNKLVQLIHNVVPPHSCFPHDWIALTDLYFLKGGMAAARDLPLGAFTSHGMLVHCTPRRPKERSNRPYALRYRGDTCSKVRLEPD